MSKLLLILGIVFLLMALSIYLMSKKLKKLGKMYDDATRQLLDIKTQFSAYSADSIALSERAKEIQNETSKDMARVTNSADPVAESISLLNDRKRKRKDT